jgi:hypothetical protein
MKPSRSAALAAAIIIGAVALATTIPGCKKAEDDPGSENREGGAAAQGGTGGSGSPGGGDGGASDDGGRPLNGGACLVVDPAGMTCEVEDDTCATTSGGQKFICSCRLDSFGLLLWMCAPDVDAGEEEDQ